MRVLLANKYLYLRAGAETVMFQEWEHLVRSGIDVMAFSMLHSENIPSLYSPYFVSNKEYRSGALLHRLRSALSLVHSREAVCKIEKLIDHARPDLVHCHNVYHQLTPSIIKAAKDRGIPVVLTVHDQKPVCPARTRSRHGQPCSLCLSGNFRHVVRHRCADGSFAHSALLYTEAVVQRWLGSYENVDRFLAPSRYVYDSLHGRFPSEQLVLLYNGVDTAKIKPTHRDHGYVLYCGRVAPGKGIETLLRAASHGGWPLVIAGDGPLLEAVRSRTASNVRFTGHLQDDELTSIEASASVVVAPSTNPENCSMSVLEAMAYGKAVVATRNGGTPELVDDGVTGFLFDAGDHGQLAAFVDRLLSDRSLRAQMGKQARLRVEARFSLEQHNAGLTKIYELVIN